MTTTFADFAAAAGEPYEYTVVASDVAGNTSAPTGPVALVTPGNRRPVANDDTTGTASGVSVIVDVLANDSDPEGDSLEIVGVSATDHGAVTCPAGGPCTYTPAAGYFGSDTFFYTVSDGNKIDVGTVAVVVDNRDTPPNANADSLTVAEDGTGIIDPLANDDDPDGDTLTLVGVAQPAHGAVACFGSACTYTPAPDFFGIDSFNYVVSDGRVVSSVGSVIVTVTQVSDSAARRPRRLPLPEGLRGDARSARERCRAGRAVVHTGVDHRSVERIPRL